MSHANSLLISQSVNLRSGDTPLGGMVYQCSLSQHLEMCLGGPHCEAIDRQHILRAGGERDDAVDLGAQRHIAARRADRGAHFDPVTMNDRNVHEEIQCAGVFGGVSPSVANAAARLSVQFA